MADFKNTLTVRGNVVWHSANDGSGSGLDADLLRGNAPSTTATANTVAVRDASGGLSSTQLSLSNSLYVGRTALGTTGTPVAFLTNVTNATAGVPVQVSPGLVFVGNSWNTTSTISQTQTFSLDALPSSGATTGGVLRIGYTLGAGATSYVMTVNQTGEISASAISLTNALAISSGGTGANTQSGAANNILPSQVGNSGKVLTTNGSVVSWGTFTGGATTLAGLSDVTITSPAQFHGLHHNGTSWVNTASPQYNALAINTSVTASSLIASTSLSVNGTAFAVDSFGNIAMNSSGATLNVNSGQIDNASSVSTEFLYATNAVHSENINSFTGTQYIYSSGIQSLIFNGDGYGQAFSIYDQEHFNVMESGGGATTLYQPTTFLSRVVMGQYVASGASASRLDVTNSTGQHTQMRVLGGAGGTKASIVLGNNDGGLSNYGIWTFDNATNEFFISQLYTAGGLGLGANSRKSDIFIASTNGNVSVGYSSATIGSQKLDVNGNIRIGTDYGTASSTGTIYLGDGSVTKSYNTAWAFNGGLSVVGGFSCDSTSGTSFQIYPTAANNSALVSRLWAGSSTASGNNGGALEVMGGAGGSGATYGNVRLNPSGGRVLVGTSTDDGSNLLQVAGNLALSGAISGLVADPGNWSAIPNSGVKFYLGAASGLSWRSKNSSGTTFFNNVDSLTVGGSYNGKVNITPWWTGNAAGWIDMPTTGPSGIGSGGPGANAWMAYVYSTGNYFSDAVPGDIAYRNTTGSLRFSTNASVSQLRIKTTGIEVADTLMLKADTWHKDIGGSDRLMYGNGSTSYYKSPVTGSGIAHEWRNGSNSAIATLNGNGNLSATTLASGTGSINLIYTDQVYGNNSLAVGAGDNTTIFFNDDYGEYVFNITDGDYGTVMESSSGLTEFFQTTNFASTTSFNGLITVNNNILMKGTSGYDSADEEASVYFGDANHGFRGTHSRGVSLFTYGVPDGLRLAQSTGNVGINYSFAALPNYKLAVNGTGYFAGTVTLATDLIVNGNTTLGDASTDTITANGRLSHRAIATTGDAGSPREIAFIGNVPYYYNGTAFAAFGAGGGSWVGTATSDLNMSTFNVLNIGYATFSSSGPRLKNNAGVLEVRNNADSAYANLTAATVNATTLSQGGTSLTSILSSYLTTATASSTYLTISNATATYAPKASPTFTGTVITSGGDVRLTNGTSNRIYFGPVGTAVPGASSNGAKIQVYGASNSAIAAADYAIGYETNFMWFNAATGGGYKWYSNSSATIATLSSAGNLTTVGHTLTAGTVTASTPFLTATQTWNSTGTTFTGISMTVTDTAAAAGSVLMDITVAGGSNGNSAGSKFNLTKEGALTVGGRIVGGTYTNNSATGTLNIDARGVSNVDLTAVGNVTLTFTNAVNNQPITVKFKQDSTGGRTLTITGQNFGDLVPSLAVGTSGTYYIHGAASKKNYISIRYDGGGATWDVLAAHPNYS